MIAFLQSEKNMQKCQKNETFNIYILHISEK